MIPVAVTPVPLITIGDPIVFVKFVPVRVTATLEPREPVFGTIEVRVGRGGFCTVNVRLLFDVPLPGTVTLTFLAVVAAAGSIVNVAMT